MTRITCSRAASLLLIVLWIAATATANPTAIYSSDRDDTPLTLSIVAWAMIFGLALAGEFLVLALLLPRASGQSTKSLLRLFVIMHAVTFPLTLLWQVPLGLKAELFPLLVEPVLFAGLARLSIKQTWPVVVLANVCSFVLGLAMGNAWLLATTQYGSILTEIGF